jgi:hypothetical protein
VTRERIATIFRREKALEISSAFDVEETAGRLNAISLPPGTFRLFNWATRKILLCGCVLAPEGKLRLRDSYLTVMSLRYFVFQLVPTESGCRLDGGLRLRNVLRFPILVYFTFCIVAECSALVGVVYRLLVKHTLSDEPYGPLMDILGPVISFGLIWSWVWIGSG